MNYSVHTNDWPSTRSRIYERFLGKIPRHKREPLDVVELIHNRFPEWSWLDIAGWMDGSQTPDENQHAKLLEWDRNLDQPCPLAMPIEPPIVDSVFASFCQDA